MRVLVIGRGFGARVVAPAFADTRGCTVVDVVSARDAPAVARAVARADVDLVTVHSPPYLHAEHAGAALDAGKAVLCDKPFTLDPVVARDLVQRARAAGVVACCNFEFRYAPARRLLRDTVAAGTLGNIERVTWTHHSNGARVPMRAYGWLFDASLGGGWIGAWGSHAVDTLRFGLGTELTPVTTQRQQAIPTRADREGVARTCTAEDGMVATLRTTAGATVVLDSSFASVATIPPRLTVFGSDAVLDIVADTNVMLRRPGRKPEPVPIAADTAGDHHDAPMRAFAAVLRDALHSGALPDDAPTFADGLACDEVLAVMRAAPLS